MNDYTSIFGHSRKSVFGGECFYNGRGHYSDRPGFAMLVASAIARAGGKYVPPFHSREFFPWMRSCASATEFDGLRIQAVRL